MLNEIFENKEKGYVRYKVAYFRKFNPTTKTTRYTNTIYFYVYKDKLRVVKSFYYPTQTSRNSSSYFTIKYKKGNFSFSKNGGRTNFQCLTSLIDGSSNTLTPTHVLRMQKIIKKWSEGLGHTYIVKKDLSIRMVFARLIWPSLQRKEYNIQFFIPPKNKRIGSLLRLYTPLKVLIKKLIGSCGKKTYKLVCENAKNDSLSKTLDSIYLLKNHFVLDDIQKILEGDLLKRITWNSYKPLSNKIVEFLASLSRSELFKKEYNFSPLIFQDSVRMWHQQNKPDIKHMTINQIHDRFAVEGRKRKSANFDLNPSKDLLLLENFEANGYTLKVPKTSHELQEWGNIMHNCVASYAGNMQAGANNLFAVFKDEEMLYNVMFSQCYTKKTTAKYYINQFYGKCNISVDKQIVSSILDELPFKIHHGGYGVDNERQKVEEEACLIA